MSLRDHSGKQPWQRRCDLTLSLYLKTGDFWDTVSAARRFLFIDPATSVPTNIRGLHLPSSAAGDAMNWYWAVDGLIENFVPPFAQTNPTPSPFERFRRVWSEGWPALRQPDLFGSWGTFISGTLLFDPPGTSLIRYAESAPLDKITARPQFDANESGQSAVASMSSLARHLLDYVREAAPRITLDRALDISMQMLEEFERRERADLPNRPCIDPLAEGFSLDQIREAASAIRANAEFSLGSNRASKSHPLLEIQCAIWYDEGRTGQEIGEETGWGVQDGHYHDSPKRCIRAEELARKGRELLANPSPAVSSIDI